MTIRRAVFLTLLALIFGGLNVLKPLHIDDAAYAAYSAQMAAHPLDPYGFEVIWYDEPQPANEVLAPPVLPYWWAMARLAPAPWGDAPWFWKLGLLPWCGLLVWSIHALLRRFAAGMEAPFTAMTVLS